MPTTTYTIHKSDGNVLTTVPDSTVVTSACSLSLIGHNAENFGTAFNENLVRLIENSAAASAPTNPLYGQFWMDKNNKTMKVYNGSAWVSIVVINDDGTASYSSGQLVSTVSTGTAPFTVASTTKVVNLNADLLDGYNTSITSGPNSIVVRDSNSDIYGNIFHGTATSAQYADLAERFEASEPLEPGDIVEIGGDKEIQKATGTSVLGVISTAPAFRMNEAAGNDETHPFVAFAGRVPCKVTGKAKKGQRVIASSIPGVAVAVNDTPSFGVIGRVLQDKDDEGVGLVMIVCGVK